MGNQCCADDVDRKQYDAVKKAFDFEPSASTIASIKFPNSKLPKKHPVV